MVTAANVGQVHLTLTGIDTEMHVSWTILGACTATSKLVWGTSPSFGQSSDVTGYHFVESDLCIYDYTITGLGANTQYYYQAGDSATFSFTNQPVVTGGKVYALLADFGIANDVSIGQLVAEAAAGNYQAVIHAGDWAYNMEYTGGTVGNDFMNAIQPIAATMPWMGAPGNHESDSEKFSNYKARLYGLQATATNSNSTTLLWYSFEDSLVHWFSFDTELWFYGGTAAQIQAQYTWLTADLASVDRSVTPWLIGFGHKARWMDSTNFTGLDIIITNGGADLVISGHQHSYQRLYPSGPNGAIDTSCVSSDGSTYTNCKLPITMIVGSPGCREQISTGAAPSQYLIKAVFDYGFAHATVVDAHTLLWQWEVTGMRDANGAFKEGATWNDTATITKA